MPHRKIEAVLSSAENACHMIVRKDLTGKKIQIVEILNCSLNKFTAVVKSVDFVKIDGPRHIIVFLTLDLGDDILITRQLLSCIKVLSDNHQEPSLSVS
jgi:hypothetical protein